MYCSCSDTISGQVRSTQGRPLINVTVTPLNTPDVILATSDVSGMFEMTSACGYQSYTFAVDGFVAENIFFNEVATTNVTLARKGKRLVQKPPLYFHKFIIDKLISEDLAVRKNPLDVNVVVSDEVTLCCNITGNPPPSYYEWYFAKYSNTP